MELPELARRREIVRRYAHLLCQFSSELGERPLVLQTGEFFPDPFTGDEASLARLVLRLQQHAGLDDIPIETRVSALSSTPEAASCSSGGCAPSGAAGPPAARKLVDLGDAWRIELGEGDLHHPVALTTHLARTLGLIFLMESSEDAAQIAAPVDATADLACVALGLGALVLEGSYVYQKSCGGPSVAQLTALSVGELAVACSAFVVAGGHSSRRALGTLGTTQKALLAEAVGWSESNAELMHLLASAPSEVEPRLGELRETRTWLAKWLGPKQRSSGEPSLEEALSGRLSDSELRQLGASRAERSRRGTPDEGRAKERHELAQLVDEALGSS